MNKQLSQSSILHHASLYMKRVTENDETEGSKSSNADLNQIYSFQSGERFASSTKLDIDYSDGQNGTPSRYKSVSYSASQL